MISDLIWLWSDFDRHCFVNLCAGVCDTMLVMDFGRFVQRPCPPQPPRTTLLVFFRGTGMIWCAIYKINTDTGTILIDIHWLKHDKHWYTRLYIIHTISYILVSDGIYLYNMQIYIYINIYICWLCLVLFYGLMRQTGYWRAGWSPGKSDMVSALRSPPRHGVRGMHGVHGMHGMKLSENVQHSSAMVEQRQLGCRYHVPIKYPLQDFWSACSFV